MRDFKRERREGERAGADLNANGWLLCCDGFNDTAKAAATIKRFRQTQTNFLSCDNSRLGATGRLITSLLGTTHFHSDRN